MSDAARQSNPSASPASPPSSERSNAQLGPLDYHLFNAGTHTRIYEKLGAHLALENGREGTRFAVWAPNAAAVNVMGEFNRWNNTATPLQAGQGGIWTGFVPQVGHGSA